MSSLRMFGFEGKSDLSRVFEMDENFATNFVCERRRRPRLLKNEFRRSTSEFRKELNYFF